MNDEPVLYSYRCAACCRRGSIHLVGDDHEGETVACQFRGQARTVQRRRSGRPAEKLIIQTLLDI